MARWEQAITWANVDPDLSPYGVTRPHWVKHVISEHVFQMKFISTLVKLLSGECHNTFDD